MPWKRSFLLLFFKKEALALREYIDVGEYDLALDDLAYLYLEAAPKPLPAELQTLFDTLAAKMGMKDGDEWRGVAKIRPTTDLPAE